MKRNFFYQNFVSISDLFVVIRAHLFLCVNKQMKPLDHNYSLVQEAAYVTEILHLLDNMNFTVYFPFSDINGKMFDTIGSQGYS